MKVKEAIKLAEKTIINSKQKNQFDILVETIKIYEDRIEELESRLHHSVTSEEKLKELVVNTFG